MELHSLMQWSYGADADADDPVDVNMVIDDDAADDDYDDSDADADYADDDDDILDRRMRHSSKTYVFVYSVFFSLISFILTSMK